jgi:CRISPR-associated endoribonuclease Cas6
MFVFSRIFSSNIKFQEEISFGNKIYFYISSPFNEFLSQFVENLLKKYEFEIYRNNLHLKELYVLPMPKFEKKMKIKMISPMTVYSTLLKGEKKKTYYYSPFEKEFEILIKENLRKKYQAFYNIRKEFDFNIKPEKVNKNLEKIIIYKGTVIKGWLGTYEIQSDEEIIKFAYDSGLGSKNSQGFGMFEICT